MSAPGTIGWGDLSLARIDASAREAAAFLARADAIPVAALAPTDRLNRDILARLLRREVDGAKFGQRQMLFGNRGGWHTEIAQLANAVPLYTLADYRSYVARLRAYPALNAQGIETTRGAIRGGFTLPCEAMQGFETTISGEIADTPEKTSFWKPFAGARPATIADADWTALKRQARAAIVDGVEPAFRSFLAFYTTDYAPHCARAVGVSAQPNGAAYYAFLAREETTDRSDAGRDPSPRPLRSRAHPRRDGRGRRQERLQGRPRPRSSVTFAPIPRSTPKRPTN